MRASELTKGNDMGMPRVILTFKGRSTDFIRRSESGIVLLLLSSKKSSEKTEDKAVFRTYNSPLDVDKKDWPNGASKYIDLAFAGGTKKVIAADLAGNAFASVKEQFKFLRFNYAAAPMAREADYADLVFDDFAQYINDSRQSKLKPALNGTWKMVVCGQNENNGAFIDFFQATVAEGEKTYTGQEYTAKVAGLLAGLSFRRSVTNLTLPEVTDAAAIKIEGGEVSEDDLVASGKLFLTYDGEHYRFSRGVNTLQTFGDGVTREMAKIRVWEAMDMIREDIYRTFMNDYSGRVLNTYDNRMLFCANITHIYFKELAGLVLDPDFDNRADLDTDAIRRFILKDGVTQEELDAMTEAEVRRYPTDARVFIKAKVKFVDTIEDLDMTIEI